MKNDIERIIIALMGVLICVFVVDFGIGEFFNAKIDGLPADGERVAKSNYVVNRVDADIIIVGSSRAEGQYDARLINEFFENNTVYNCGVDGQLFWYTDIVINNILRRYSPKIIIWDFQLRDFVDEQEENLSLLYPYFGDNHYITDRLLQMDPRLNLLLRLKSYKYNGTAGRILRASQILDSPQTLGFHSKETADKTRLIKPQDYAVSESFHDTCKVAQLEQTIIKCKENKVQLILVISPMYSKYTGEPYTIEVLKKISKRYSVPFLDYSQNEYFVHNAKLIYDAGHLNAQGAKEFTGMLIADLAYMLQ